VLAVPFFICLGCIDNHNKNNLSLLNHLVGFLSSPSNVWSNLNPWHERVGDTSKLKFYPFVAGGHFTPLEWISGPPEISMGHQLQYFTTDLPKQPTATH